MAGAMAVALGSAMAVAAATLNSEPGDWTKPVGDQFGKITFSSSSPGGITIAFASRGQPPPPAIATVVANGTAFRGDFITCGARGATFQITGDGHTPAYLFLFLRGNKSQRLWRSAALPVAASAGVVTVNRVSFSRQAAGWTTDYAGNANVMWAEDLRDVASIGFVLAQGSTAAETYTVDEFKLLSVDGFLTVPATLTPLEQALLSSFGVVTVDKLSATDKKRDSDNDGMADWMEILSENDPAFAASIFMGEVLPSAAGVVVKWPCISGASYSLFRTSDFSAGFRVLSAATGLVATNTGYMTYLDTTATGDGPYFYKIRKD